MNPGYLFWGTGDGFSSNLLGNRTESSIDLKMLDDKIRPVKVRNGNSLTEVYYLIFEHGQYLFASAVDPTAKDNQGREGFLVCSVYFDKQYAIKGGVVEVLNFLIKSYKEKKSANQILTHGECESKMAYLTLENSQVNRSSSSIGTIVTKCTSASELNLALANRMLGFAPTLAYLFLSDVEGIRTLPADCKLVSWDEISLRSRQLSAAVETESKKKREDIDSAHNQFRQILAMGESGNTEQAGTILLKMVPSHSIYSELLKYPEYFKLNAWYSAAVANDQLQSQQREREFVDEVYRTALGRFENGDLQGAKSSLSKLSKSSISKNPRLQKLQSDISDREKSIGFKKKMILASLILGVTCLIGGGVFFFMNSKGNGGEVTGPDSGGQVTTKDPMAELSSEWPKNKSADIQLFLKAVGITGYDTLSGKLTWSSGAKCYVLAGAKDGKTHHIPFDLIDKMAKISDREKVVKIIGENLNDIDYYLKIQKSLIFIGKNNKYSMQVNEQNQTIEFTKLNESYVQDGVIRVLSATTNADLFNSSDVQYVYKTLGFSAVNQSEKVTDGNSGTKGNTGNTGNTGNAGNTGKTGSGQTGGSGGSSHGRIRP